MLQTPPTPNVIGLATQISDAQEMIMTAPVQNGMEMEDNAGAYENDTGLVNPRCLMVSCGALAGIAGVSLSSRASNATPSIGGRVLETNHRCQAEAIAAAKVFCTAVEDMKFITLEQNSDDKSGILACAKTVCEEFSEIVDRENKIHEIAPFLGNVPAEVNDQIKNMLDIIDGQTHEIQKVTTTNKDFDWLRSAVLISYTEVAAIFIAEVATHLQNKGRRLSTPKTKHERITAIFSSAKENIDRMLQLMEQRSKRDYQILAFAKAACNDLHEIVVQKKTYEMAIGHRNTVSLCELLASDLDARIEQIDNINERRLKFTNTKDSGELFLPTALGVLFILAVILIDDSDKLRRY